MNTAHKDGLSNFAVGSLALEQLVQPTEIENLSFISAGSTVPDPAVLLGLEKIKDFIESVKTHFDRIIIDSAPVLPVSDTLNIAAMIDGVVLVIYSGKMSHNVAGMSKKKLSDVGARIVGAILNQVNIDTRGYQGYSYYGYGKY